MNLFTNTRSPAWNVGSIELPWMTKDSMTNWRMSRASSSAITTVWSVSQAALPEGLPSTLALAPLLLDTCGLAAQAPQVVQLRPAHVAPAHHLDALDAGRVQRKGTLDPDAV